MRRMVAVLLLVLVALPLRAAETSLTVTGEVEVVRQGDMVTSIRLASSQGSYTLELNQQARRLAAYQGKRVEVTGSIIDVDGKRLLRVASFKLVQNAS